MLFAASAAAQTPDPGREVYVSRCAGCHGSDGNGGELGPGIVDARAVAQRPGSDDASPPGPAGRGHAGVSDLSDTETGDLIRFLRTLRPRKGSGPVRTTVTLTGGRSLAGLVLNQGTDDLQLLGDDRKIHLLRKSGDRYRPVTSQADWPSYNGQTSGSRYSPLTQITKGNVARLAPKWIFSLPNTSRLQVTPVVVDGVMYVTSANECYALDAGAAADLALPAPADQRADRQRRRRRQPRRRRRRRPRVHGHRSRASHRAQSLDRRAAVGNRNGGLAPELQRDRRAAAGGQPGGYRHRPAATKACAGSSPRSIRPPARKSGASGRCRAGRAGIGDVAGQAASSIRARRRG